MERDTRYLLAGLAGTAFFSLLAIAFPGMSQYITIPGAIISFVITIYFLWPEIRKSRRMWLIVGMVVSAGCFVACAFALVKRPTEQSNPLDKTLLVECERGKLPDTIPPQGIIYLMQINESLAPKTLNLGKIPGKPGDKYNGWIVKEDDAYRCRVKNYGDKPVFHIGMTFTVDYKKVVQHPSGIGSGESTGQNAEYPIVITDIPAGEAFEFYIYNLSSLYPLITVPTTATLKQLGSDDWLTIKLRVVTNGSFFLPPYTFNNKYSSTTIDNAPINNAIVNGKGGKGGDAKVVGSGIAIGGAGGRGGKYGNGGDGGSAEVHGDGLAAGGAGGSVDSDDLWSPPAQSGYEIAMEAKGQPIDPKMRQYGRGGMSPGYAFRYGIVEKIREEYFKANNKQSINALENVNAVPIDYVNEKLAAMNVNWRARIVRNLDYEFYVPSSNK